ncbi:hypothetical protein YC2023_009084 [Brassica napus]
MPLLTYPSLPSLLSGDTETRKKTSSPVSISTLFQLEYRLVSLSLSLSLSFDSGFVTVFGIES